ncbi:MAG: metallophosphoesterase family protein [Clostridia bacterium]
MRLAVFSDMHANAGALAACIGYANHVGVDGYVFLGDHLTDCPYPRMTLDLMREAQKRLPTWMLRGNREDYLIRHHDGAQDGWKPSSGTGSLLYTYQNITPEDIEFLRAMPITDVIALPGCPAVRIAHASPASNNVMLFPGAEALESILRDSAERTLLMGHSHFQFRYESAGRQVINPGTVGMPSNGQPKAQFAFLTCAGNRWSARLMNVDYDKQAEIEQFATSGLSEMSRVWAKCTIKTIRDGGRWAVDCMQLARKLTPPEREIPETAWEDAAMQLGIM